ncbi:MAG: ABC transporter ATP-binding protein [Pseudomonadota bacterium]|nr:ABC transporter ATP-binding protein [Pseudomonadota bacterium]
MSVIEPVPAVELRAVAKHFGDTVALHELDLVIRKGEFFSLLGASGCGKTTTLNLIGGFEEATRGSIRIDGQEVQGVPPYQRPVNTVFQSYALFPHMTVAENVGFGLSMKRVPAEERRLAVAEMLRLVSLEGFGERRTAQLSGGQRQRVALARALINRPSVLLLDEPLGALDLKLRKQMQTELTRIQRRIGITFVYVTHDQEEALAMSDRIAVMDKGRLLQVGTPSEIYEAPASRAVMEFIGSANALEGVIAADGSAHMEVPRLGRLPTRGIDGLAPGKPAALLVRPERMRITSRVENAPPGSLAGSVSKITELGSITQYRVRLENEQEVLVLRLNRPEADSASPTTEEQQVRVWWPQEDAKVFDSSAAATRVGTQSPVSP